MGDWLKTIFEALTSNLKTRITFALACFSICIVLKWFIPSFKQKIFWIIGFIFFGFLFSFSILAEYFLKYLDKKKYEKKQKLFEQRFKVLKGPELQIIQKIWSSKQHSIIMGEDEPIVIELEDQDFIEKVNGIPEYSMFGSNRPFQYRLTRTTVREILKEIHNK